MRESIVLSVRGGGEEGSAIAGVERKTGTVAWLNDGGVMHGQSSLEGIAPPRNGAARPRFFGMMECVGFDEACNGNGERW